MSLTKTITCQIILSMLAIIGCSKDPKKLVESGKKYLAEAKYNEALIELRSAVNLNPQLTEAHYELAVAYLAVGQMPAAKQELERTVLLQPGNMQAQLKYGKDRKSVV